MADSTTQVPRPRSGQTSSRGPLRRTTWVAVIVVWTLLALVSAGNIIALRLHEGRSADAGRIVAASIGALYSCAVFVPAILWLGQHFPISRRHWRRIFTIHVPATLAFWLAAAALWYATIHVFGLTPSRTRYQFVDYLYFDAYGSIVTYWAVIAAGHALDLYDQVRARGLRASQLEARLAQVRLDALTRQLQPHFLFNALNAITALMHTDVAAADRLVVQLSELLRLSLSRGEGHEVPLRDEIAFLERYLGIMQERLGNRLAVEWSIEPGAGDAFVPQLILQPLVENALQHGIARRAEAAMLRVGAARRGDELHLTVDDDGAGVAAQAERKSEGMGLANTRQRLEQLYGDSAELRLEPLVPSGTRAVVRMPFVLAPMGAAV